MSASHIRRSLRFLVAAATATVIAACMSAPSPSTFTPIGFLAVGDTGYHYDWLDAEDIAPSSDAFIALEHQEWLEDHRPPEDFAPGAMAELPNGRGFAAASGLLPVAAAMKQWCTHADCEFATLLGDNVYPDGLELDGDDATRLRKLFVEPFGDFGTLARNFRIFAALGNHDWKTSREAALAQVDFFARTSPFYMDGLFYRVVPRGHEGDVELFVLDTQVLLSSVSVHEAALTAEGNEVVYPELEEPDAWERPQNAAEREMVQWLERSLRESTARWKIVVGHHPLWSSAGSKFEQARVLRSLLLPTLCRYADLYLAGHEHTLEAHTDDCRTSLGTPDAQPLLNIVSGAGAKQRPLHRTFMLRQDEGYPEHRSLFAQGLVWGFAHVTLDAEQATVRLVTTPNDGRGEPVQAFEVSTPRRSATLR